MRRRKRDDDTLLVRCLPPATDWRDLLPNGVPVDGKPTTSDLDGVDDLAEEYLQRLRRGERPTPAEFAARCPEHAARILELFPALELIEGLKLAAGDQTGGIDNGLGSGDLADDDRGPRRLGDYTLLRELGRGGMGIVYEAEHDSLKNRVALKVMHPRFRTDRSYVRRFQTEARSAARLHHTNIVPVFDYGEQDGVCYYAMQYIAGVGLERILEDVRRLRSAAERDHTAALGTHANLTACKPVAGPMLDATRGLLTGRFANLPTAAAIAPTTPSPTNAMEPSATAGAASASASGELGPASRLADTSASSHSFASHAESVYCREIARLGAQVADALDYAHRQRVIHRDIKPSNLLLDSQGNIWVTDFGLAKLLEGDDLSRSQDLVGTLRFMPPERFRGITNPQGDIYSLGATLYELLSLRPIFPETDQARLIDLITRQAPLALRRHDRRIPRDLETLVQRALAKDPKDRFARASDLADELRRHLESRPIQSRPVGAIERTWRWCKRSPGLATACIGAALLTVIMLVGSIFATAVLYQKNIQIQSADRKINERLLESLRSEARATRLSRQVGQRFRSLDVLAQAVAIARDLNVPHERLDLLRDEVIACLALPDLKPTGRVIQRPPGVNVTAFDAMMRRYALRSRDGTILVKNVSDDQEVARFRGRGDLSCFIFCLSPDGRYLANVDFPGSGLTVWDVDLKTIALIDPGPVLRKAARFSPDSTRIAIVRETGEIAIHDLKQNRPPTIWAGQGLAEDLAFRPDCRQIAVTNRDANQPACRILELESGQIVQTIKLKSVASVAWSPDGLTLAIPAPDSIIELWDVRSGVPRAKLEGATNAGLHAAFLPAGKLLATNGWEGALRIWDAATGRPVLSLPAWDSPVLEFSRDGRIAVPDEDQLTIYQVEPALEYQTYVHPFGTKVTCWNSAIRNDGRLLALNTNHGVALWDLARRVELPFLPLGHNSVVFEPSGDLLTSTASLGVARWPIRLDPDRGLFKIGPPSQLPMAVSGSIAQDRTGQVVAVTLGSRAIVTTPERTIQVGPLDDCRSIAVSPDGQWLATGSHDKNGAQVWHLPDRALAHQFRIEGIVGVTFSPDGKWLMTNTIPCKLWSVHNWQEARQIGGWGLCFSPDGRHVLVRDAHRTLRMADIETGRTIARLESPEMITLGHATYSPDSSRVVTISAEDQAVHVWNLRSIRGQLAAMGLDWDAPAFSRSDPADPSLPPLTELTLDLGPLICEFEHPSEPVEMLLERLSARLKDHPDDVDAYHHRGHVFAELHRLPEAIADFGSAVRLRSGNEHLKANLALAHNNSAWALVTAADPTRESERALDLARRAVDLAPDKAMYLNTLGVAEYRAGQYTQAIATFERSLAAGRGAFDAFDLFFLAMAHHRQGRREQARACFDRAVRWREQRNFLSAGYIKELAAFRAEAESVMAGPAGELELPADVFVAPH